MTEAEAEADGIRSRDLAQKLAALRRIIAEKEAAGRPCPGAGPATVPAPGSAGPSVRQPHSRPIQRPAVRPIETCLPGEVRQTAEGRFFLHERAFPLEHQHGRRPLAGALTFRPEEGGRLSPGGTDLGFDPVHAVFLDTETTGLATTSGTLAFLIGTGFFSGSTFVVRQYFVPDFADEEACLRALREDLGRFDAVVTFNGRSFDLPLLEARYITSRLRPPLAGATHLDLLPACRRLFRQRIGGCRLAELENAVLGFYREDDIPGELIPQMYFDYLRSGDAAPLAGVFEHNRHDILAMAALLAEVQAVVQGCRRGEGHPIDLFSLACADEREGRLEDSRALYERALALELPPAQDLVARKRLSLLYKRMGLHDHAADLWRQMCDQSTCLSLFPFIELAKDLEHRHRDPAAARQVVLAALSRSRALDQVFSPNTVTSADLEKRLRRLERKAGVSPAPAPAPALSPAPPPALSSETRR